MRYFRATIQDKDLKTIVESIATYGAELWGIQKKDVPKLQTIEKATGLDAAS